MQLNTVFVFSAVGAMAIARIILYSMKCAEGIKKLKASEDEHRRRAEEAKKTP